MKKPFSWEVKVDFKVLPVEIACVKLSLADKWLLRLLASLPQYAKKAYIFSGANSSDTRPAISTRPPKYRVQTQNIGKIWLMDEQAFQTIDFKYGIFHELKFFEFLTPDFDYYLDVHAILKALDER